MKLSPKVTLGVDAISSIAALVVEVAMLFVTWVAIGPDLWLKVGLSFIAFVVPLFSIRSWLIRNKHRAGWPLWSIFAAFGVFSHTSYLLIVFFLSSQSMTEQTEKPKTDPIRAALIASAEAKDKAAADMAAKIAGLAEGFRSEVGIRQEGYSAAENEASAAWKRVLEYKTPVVELTENSSDHSAIDAWQFIGSIPAAIKSADPVKITGAAIILLLMAGMQLVMVVGAEGALSKIPSGEPAVVKRRRRRKAKAETVEPIKPEPEIELLEPIVE